MTATFKSSFPVLFLMVLEIGGEEQFHWQDMNVHHEIIGIPNTTLITDNANICVSFRIPSAMDTSYITNIQINASEEFNGDMMFTVCEETGFPGLDKGSAVWDCSLGDRHTRPNPPLPRGYPCTNGGEEGKDGPFFFNYLTTGQHNLQKKRFTPPQGTGVAVGGQTGIKYIVIDSHFYHRRQEVDGYTGGNEVLFTLTQSQTPMRSVQSLEIEAQGFLGPESVGVVTGSWTMRSEFRSMSILSVSTHSHALSIAFEIWIEKEEDASRKAVVSQDPRHSMHQTDMSPPFPVVEVGDRLVIACTYNNTLASYVRVGIDEMCVAYIHYTGDGDMSQMPPYVKSFDSRYADCFAPYFQKGDEQNSDGWSSYDGVDHPSDCGILFE